MTDFVLERDEQEYVLIEIERPDFPLFTRHGDPTAKLTHAQRQVEDWLDWISDNKDYAQRHILPGISEPEGWVNHRAPKPDGQEKQEGAVSQK